ncbi:TPA: helix-turn-helix transcriptional regulator [Serratia marcescens]
MPTVVRALAPGTDVHRATVGSTGRGILARGTCVRVLGCLGSRAQSTALLGLVAQGLQHLEDREAALPQYCPQCVNTTLTEREMEVMCCMARGIAQKQLTQRLHISHKTVSSHKRAVMRKLGFRRNVELYHWLRLGGLEQIKRP